jgi:membrane-associated HD superfamily phosphohydrolase
MRDAAVFAVEAAATGDNAKVDDARNRAADAIAKAQNIPVDQARIQVDQYLKTYNDSIEAAKAKALEAAQTATMAVSAGAILGFIALLIGAIAAWFGGVFGTKHNLRATETSVRHVT